MWVRIPPRPPMPLKPITFTEKDLKKLFKPNTPVARIWRQVRRLMVVCIWFLIIFGVFFYAINGPAFWQRANFATRGISNAQPLTVLPPSPTVNYDPELIISKIGLRAPVIYDATYNSILENLRNGVVRYEGTADPGQVGNLVIVGHSSDYPWSTGNYKTIFALLDKLGIGDEIVLPYETNRYVYVVSQTKIVRPTDLSVLGRTASPNLTLITCYPVGTTLNRLVITATLSAGPVGSRQTTEPFLGERLTSGR